mgnify:CR=1 FL=1
MSQAGEARGAATGAPLQSSTERKNVPLGFACATRQPFELDQFLPNRFEISILGLNLGKWQVLKIECGFERREAGVLVERRKVVRFGAAAGAGTRREFALDDL